MKKMERMRPMAFACLVLVMFSMFFCVLPSEVAAEEPRVVEEDFHMRPGVDEQEARLVSEEVGVVCSFKYRCSGGTGENWKIRLMPLESNRFLCSVGRPNPPSYLLTSHFTLAVEPVDESTTIKLADANLQGGGKIVPSAQYVVDTQLAQVRPSEAWGGSLEQINAEIEVEKRPRKKKATKKKAAKNTNKEEL